MTSNAGEFNLLIDRLPIRQRRRFLKQCVPVELRRGDILARPGEVEDFVYFPTGACLFLQGRGNGDAGLCVGLVGREGMSGMAVALGGVLSVMTVRVQGGGGALCMTSGNFRSALEDGQGLRRTVNRYAIELFDEIARTATCTNFHGLRQRLARWLLMTHDRTTGDAFFSTQAHIGTLLGVRRTGVSIAAASLRKSGLICYSRGDIRVLDRSGLEGVSCACYGESAAVRHQVFG